MSAQGPYRASLAPPAAARPAGWARRVLACLEGIGRRFDEQARRHELVRLARLNPGRFARYMHAAPNMTPAATSEELGEPAITARDARRAMRSCNPLERAAIGHAMDPECWTCRAIWTDQDPGAWPHGRLEDLATKRIAGLIKEQR